MAERTYYNYINGTFFNSINSDRLYNANNLCEWLSTTNSDGVVPQPVGQLKVLEYSGMVVQVSVGKSLISGHSAILTSLQSVTVDASPANASYSRIDVVGMRINYSLRRCEIFYRSGTEGTTPSRPALTYDGSTYDEIALAYITVAGGSSEITQANITDAREFTFSTSTFFNELRQVVNTTSTINTLRISVQYNSNKDIINIYKNGNLLNRGSEYTITNNVISFTSPVYTGNTILVQVWHFTNAAGLEQLDLTDMETAVDGMNKYYYYCDGTNDNITLSDIAQNFLAGTGDFVGVDANAQMELIICGDMGIINQFYSGNGTQAYPYTYFAFGRGQESTRTIYFNFSNCSRILVSAPSTEGVYATIFSGADINVRNVALNVGSGYDVAIFNGTNIHCQDSEFWMATTNDCYVGICCGIFDNVRTSITSSNGNACGFFGNGRLLRVIGGTHYAYTGNAGGGKEAVCFYVEAYQTENVLFMSQVNCPQHNRSGYSQTDTIKVNHGYATIVACAIWKAPALYSNTNCVSLGNVIISKN